MASDAPTIKTPEGAINPNPTGIKHGPFGMHSPTFPIIQLDAGTVAAKAEIKLTQLFVELIKEL